MAKRSKIVRNERRREVVARYAARRAELKEILRRPSSTDAERLAARQELSRQPRDASATRRGAFWLTVCGKHHRNGTVIPGREANPESRDSESGPADHCLGISNELFNAFLTLPAVTKW